MHYPLLVLSHHQVASHSWPEGHRLVLWEAGMTYIRMDPKDDLLPEIYIAAEELSVKGEPLAPSTKAGICYPRLPS